MANLYDFPNASLGPDKILIGLAEEIPMFPIMFLIAIYFIVMLSGGLAQSSRKGYIDFPMWSMIGLLSVDLLALLMTLQSGVINGIVLGVCFGLTILNALWLFLSVGRFESV